ncbi:MAG: hypothetical protein LKG17_06905 [Megasphaera sp.]|nr:hypothetical protein [Megasphaera sp.]
MSQRKSTHQEQNPALAMLQSSEPENTAQKNEPKKINTPENKVPPSQCCNAARESQNPNTVLNNSDV